jgi:hypothetical protein
MLSKIILSIFAVLGVYAVYQLFSGPFHLAFLSPALGLVAAIILILLLLRIWGFLPRNW